MAGDLIVISAGTTVHAGSGVSLTIRIFIDSYQSLFSCVDQSVLPSNTVQM